MAQAPDFVLDDRERAVSRNRSPRNRFLKPALLLALGVALLLGLFFGGRYWLYAQGHEDTSNAAIESNVYQVQAVIPGVVSEVLVQENQPVKRGDILARLDSREIHLRERQAATAVKLARQQSEAARLQVVQISAAVGLRAQQVEQNAERMKAAARRAQGDLKKLSVAEAQVRKALKAAEDNLRHVTNQNQNFLVLARQGFASPHAAEQAEGALRNAKAEVDAAKNQLRAIHSKTAQLKQLVAQVKSAKVGAVAQSAEKDVVAKQIAAARQQYAASLTAVKQAELAAEHARLAAYYMTITAPADGIVARRAIQVGQRVQPGQPVVALVQPGTWVVANFDEKQIGRIQPGQRVAVKVAAMPSRVIWGRVESTAPAAFLQVPQAGAPAKPVAAPKSTAPASAKDSGAPVGTPVVSGGPASEPEDKVAVATATNQPPKAVQPSQPQARPIVTRTVPVKITFEEQSLKGMERFVLPGMSAHVSVQVKS